MPRQDCASHDPNRIKWFDTISNKLHFHSTHLKIRLQSAGMLLVLYANSFGLRTERNADFSAVTDLCSILRDRGHRV